MPLAEELVYWADRQFTTSKRINHVFPGQERRDAETLLALALGDGFAPGDRVAEAGARRFRRLVHRHEAGEPTAYITRQVTFRGIPLVVGPGAFIPRQSSECLAELAIKRLRGRREPVLVDLGTGVGPIALTVGISVPHVQVFGIDLAARPIALARINVRSLGVRNVRFLRGDLFGPLPKRLKGRVDVVAAYLPYVPRRHMSQLVRETRAFEPEEAITDSSSTGLRILRRASEESAIWLRPGGWLLMQVSPFCSREVARLFRNAGLWHVRTLVGRHTLSRILVGRLS
jgi:release factor glutamine methyltransferase